MPAALRSRVAIRIGLLGLVVIGFGLAGYATRPQSSSGLPPAPAGPAAASAVRGTVQSIGNGSLVVSTEAGPVTLSLAASVPVETFAATTLAAARPSDLVNVIAVPHNQTLFAITGIVFVPPALLKAAP